MFSLTENGPSSFDLSSRRLISSLVRNAILGPSIQSGMLGCAFPCLTMTPRTSSESFVCAPGFVTIRILLTSIVPSSVIWLMASDRSLLNLRLSSCLPQSTTSKRRSSRSSPKFLAISLMITIDPSAAFRYPSRIVLAWKPTSISLSASVRSAETRTRRVVIPSPVC